MADQLPAVADLVDEVAASQSPVLIVRGTSRWVDPVRTASEAAWQFLPTSKRVESLEAFPVDALAGLVWLRRLILSSHHSLGPVLSLDLSAFSVLETLVLLNNALEEVDGLAAAAPSLTSLALSKNRLQACPPAVVDLTRLVTLKLDYNPLLTIPRSVSRLSALTKLSLAHTQVRRLPVEVAALARVRDLDLSGITGAVNFEPRLFSYLDFGTHCLPTWKPFRRFALDFAAARSVARFFAVVFVVATEPGPATRR